MLALNLNNKIGSHTHSFSCWVIYRETNMGEGKGVPNIADQTVTDSCEHLSVVAVHRDSGRGQKHQYQMTHSSLQQSHKVVVGEWAEILGAVFFPLQTDSFGCNPQLQGSCLISVDWWALLTCKGLLFLAWIKSAVYIYKHKNTLCGNNYAWNDKYQQGFTVRTQMLGVFNHFLLNWLQDQMKWSLTAKENTDNLW